MLAESFSQAVELVVTGDGRVYSAAFVSVWVAAISTVIASVLGLPLGFLLAVRRFRGRDFIVTLLNTLLALPTVVVGLTVYSFIRREGPLGPLDLLFTPSAIVIAQVVLAVPIVAALSRSAVESLSPSARETVVACGASPWQTLIATAWEARMALAAAVAAAGGRLIGEVGVSMIVGGNIAGRTRTLTTAIALETARGEFEFALALGIVLLLLALMANFALRWLHTRAERQR